jgi:exosortase/archaeosortase family protein
MSEAAIRPHGVRRARRHHDGTGGVRGAAGLTVRIVVALVLAASGALVMLGEHSIRVAETRIAARVAEWVLADVAFPSTRGGQPSVTFVIDERWFSLIVTPECSVAFYIGPILLLGAAIVLIRRVPIHRVLLAASVSAALLIALNQARFLGLAFALSHFGRNTFDWWHSLGGSFLMLSGVALSLFLFFRLVVRDRPRTRRAAR